ncbi:MAG: nitroreductase family protein [Burkholderiaceae bacterium]|nr:nitroreductase family protein [Burkholderiaceae bacterium]
MKPYFKRVSTAGLLTFALLAQSCTAAPDESKPQALPQALPAPQMTGGKPLMQVLKERRTVRDYDSSKAIPPQTLSNLLWAAFGVNRPDKKGRTAPSAHDVQEISLYVVTQEGAWLYDAQAHQLQSVHNKDIRALTGKQGFVKDAPVNLVYVADWSKFTSDDDDTKRFYSAADTGFISQNVYLFCASEGLATMVRAYIDQPALAQALNLKPNQHIILAQSVGYPKQ